MRLKWSVLRCSLLLSALLVLSSAGGVAAKEGLRFMIDPQWAFLKDETVSSTYTMTFVPQGQTGENWEHLFEVVETARKNYPQKADDAYAQLLETRLQSCPDTRSELLEQDQASLIFEMFTSNCPPGQDQYQATRILYGKKKAYIMIFTSRSGQVSPELRESWLKVLRQARVQ